MGEKSQRNTLNIGRRRSSAEDLLTPKASFVSNGTRSVVNPRSAMRMVATTNSTPVTPTNKTNSRGEQGTSSRLAGRPHLQRKLTKRSYELRPQTPELLNS